MMISIHLQVMISITLYANDVDILNMYIILFIIRWPSIRLSQFIPGLYAQYHVSNYSIYDTIGFMLWQTT